MLEQKILDLIIKYKLIEEEDKIVLGISGGPDSICMLHILHQIIQKGLLHFEIVVAHVNHGLRENAKLDEEFVKSFCEKMEVPFFVKHAKVKEIAQKQKRGLEETGRIIRYDFFEEIMRKTNANKIAIAHHADDNAETIIMNILRGTGIRGLIGMEKINGKYIRPLLEIKRSEIEVYLHENKIEARHDESNDDNYYTRNKIRNIVLPYIKTEFNPSIITSLERLSSIAKEQEEYLQKETEKYYEQICIEEIKVTENYLYNKSNNAEIIMDLKQFNALEKVMQKRLILYAIYKIFGTTKSIEKVHMEDIIKLCNNNIGNKFLTPNKYLKIVTQKKQLRIMAVTGKSLEK